VVLGAVGVHRLEPARRRGDGGLRVPHLVADDGVLGVEAGRQHLRNSADDAFAWGSVVPTRSAALQRGLARHQVSGNDGDRGIADAHDLLHPGRFITTSAFRLFTLPAEHRAVDDRGVEHAGSLRSIRRHRPLVFSTVSKPARRLPGERPVLRVLERRVRGRRQLARPPATLP